MDRTFTFKKGSSSTQTQAFVSAIVAASILIFIALCLPFIGLAQPSTLNYKIFNGSREIGALTTTKKQQADLTIYKSSSSVTTSFIKEFVVQFDYLVSFRNGQMVDSEM